MSTAIHFTKNLLPPLALWKSISKKAELQGVKAYVIGGYVRDILLQKECKDIDIVVLGSGIDLAKALAEELGSSAKFAFFKNFGTAQITIDDYQVEFVGARKESYRLDSRKPIVEEGSLEDDQKRRDFTINALSISLNKEDFGLLIDPFNGLQDLNNKLIRTPLDPDTTFSDDPLRMMRAIRFASQLQFTIVDEALESITRNAERMRIVSQERITDELNKIILSPIPSVGFKLLFNTKLLPIVFPEMQDLHGIDYIEGKGHKDNFYHTLQVLDNICPNTNDLWLRWSAILHDIAKPATKRFDKKAGWTFHGHEDRGARMVPQIFKKLRLPLDHKMKFVQKMVKLHLRPIALSKKEVTDSGLRRLIVETGDELSSLMTLCEADITSKNDEKVKRYLQNFYILRQKLKEVEESDNLRNWQPPITGEIIMQTFNLQPCKEVGILKTKVREAILDNQIENNYEAAFTYLLQEAELLGLKPI